MAEPPKQLQAAAALTFASLPIQRQIVLLAGLALSISVGVATFMWFQKPSFTVLYSTLAQNDAVGVIDALTKADIPYRLDQSSGAIMVPGDQVHKARLRLAMDGLPEGGNLGFELLDKDRGFGASPLMENARYQRAIEGELGRSIASLKYVHSARVHLAAPTQSVFVRDRKPPSASVLLELYPGRVLRDGQVAAIVHLVASSIPNLSADDVTVVDQNGHLLTSKNNREMMQAAFEFDFVRKVEREYVKRIENILEPFVGRGGVRAQVVADLDLTRTEQTQEIFDPDLRALRSEQTIEEQSSGGASAGGVPGSLSNQPPPAGQIRGAADQAGQTGGAGQGQRSRRSNRNFDLSRTINHTRLPMGSIKRLSVAVVLNNKQSVSRRGKVTSTPLTAAELVRITGLVKKAIGFDVQRGDSVNIINTAFVTPPKVEPLPAPPIWEAPWLRDVLKVIFGIIVAAVFFLGLMRPVMRSLASKAILQPLPLPQAAVIEAGSASQPVLEPASEFKRKLNTAKSMVGDDPKRVAKVVKSWIAEDE